MELSFFYFSSMLFSPTQSKERYPKNGYWRRSLHNFEHVDIIDEFCDLKTSFCLSNYVLSLGTYPYTCDHKDDLEGLEWEEGRDSGRTNETNETSDPMSRDDQNVTCELYRSWITLTLPTSGTWINRARCSPRIKTRYMYVACLSNVMWIQYAQYCCTPVLVLDARKWFHRKLMKRKEAFEDTNCSSLQWSCGGRRERAEGWNYRFAPKVRRKNISEPFLSWEGTTTSQTSH